MNKVPPKKGAIWYKDTWAMPGSQLLELITEAAKTTDPKKRKELSDKAEKLNKETTAAYNKLSGIK